jgi:hypothetical protein
MHPTALRAAGDYHVCARHGTERARCKSSCQVFAEPKARRRARASTARWGLEEAPSTRAGRRTGTGYEVWYTRDERARDCEVLHPQGVCLIHPASTRGTFCGVPWEIWMVSMSQVWMKSRGTAGKPGGNRENKPHPEATTRTERGEISSDRYAEVSRGHSRHARAC